MAEQLGLAWEESSLSTGSSYSTACPPLVECVWLMAWVKAQTPIDLTGLPGWGKWGEELLLVRFKNN